MSAQTAPPAASSKAATTKPAAAKPAVSSTKEATKTAATKPAAKKPAAKKKSAKKPAAKPAPEPVEEPTAYEAADQVAIAIDEVDAAQPVAQDVIDLAGWVIASHDNRDLPFAVVDKEAAQILVFSADGKLRGLAPALIGSAVGDTSAEGVGDRELKDIPMEDRTTPAGRFHASYGPAAGGQKVLWVDFTTSVSIHPIANTRPAKKEKRKERLASPTVEDNRITHGCINVSPAFYSKIVSPTFKKSGIFYILPDSSNIRTAFPAFEPPVLVSRKDKSQSAETQTASVDDASRSTH